MNSDRPILSIGMIVKNEMRCLGRCLAALKPLREALPCELVIADTGSADGTRALAAEHADRVFDFEWCDDFSAARNAVLDRCGGIWHMQVDADEYLDADCVPRLVEFLTGREAEESDLGMVTVRNYQSDALRAESSADFTACRLLRRASGARFHGAIHEAPEILPGARTARLTEVVFHHDGYALHRRAEKKNRNLPLLQRALEREPGDIRRIVQCLESSAETADLRKYALMAAAAAETEGDPLWRMAAFHDAIVLTAELGFPELPRWGEKARALFPRSILVAVGAAYGLGVYFHGIGDYENALREADAYFRAAQRYDAGDYDPREPEITGLKGITGGNRKRMAILRADCLRRLERWNALAEALGGFDLSGEPGEAVYAACLEGLTALWRHGEPGAEALLQRALQSLSGEEYERFAGLCRGKFRASGYEPERNWRLFAALGDGCDLGRFGLLMDAGTKAGAERLLHAVERLALLPPEALAHALSLGAALPEGIFRMNGEEIAASAKGLAALLTEEPDSAMALCPEGEDHGRILWGFTIAWELARSVDWPRNGSVELFDFLCARGERYFAAFFSEALLREEHRGFLPREVRFVVRCGEARAARMAGDELRYVRGLRSALQDAPDMKDMVNWLLGEAKERAAAAKQQAAPELIALARQVKALLAQYPADHPAVREIKNSPLYQQVAYLIED